MSVQHDGGLYSLRLGLILPGMKINALLIIY